MVRGQSEQTKFFWFLPFIRQVLYRMSSDWWIQEISLGRQLRMQGSSTDRAVLVEIDRTDLNTVDCRHVSIVLILTMDVEKLQ